jgi:PleD family two-component response regulator
MINENGFFRILVIEDNPRDFILVEEFLSGQFSDPHIEHALDFKQACAAMATDEDLYDIILLDLSLPDKRGKDLIAAMSELAMGCPIIILTGLVDIELSIHSISQGVSDYLIKDDLNAITLYKSICYAIERRRIIDQLEEKNEKLREIAWIQSHKIRAPLARMMGLICLIEDMDIASPVLLKLLHHLTGSATELDNIIRNMAKQSDYHC